jgi:hypothetical protein
VARKNEVTSQASRFGVPQFTPIRILVPPGINPQGLVNDWTAKSHDFTVTKEFFNFWHDPANDYKRTSPIYDAFGNFEYGATGAAAGFAYSTLQTVAELLHWNHNDPINHDDIKSGYDAISKGGTLSIRQDTLTP